MTKLVNATNLEGLRFFGRMSASISHDLKNTLSIMNESAGLLEDLASMAEKGRPLDAQRIKALGATIKRQIQRTDGIVRNMNRFSHSVDDPFKEIGLTVSLELLLTICRRLIDARGIQVTIAPCDTEVTMVTRPFFLYHLVWQLLDHCLNVAGPSKRIEIHIEQALPSVRLIFKGLETLASQSGLDEALQELLTLLGARLEIEIADRTLSVHLPQRIDGTDAVSNNNQILWT
jgi:signal transduction histidine kinase